MEMRGIMAAIDISHESRISTLNYNLSYLQGGCSICSQLTIVCQLRWGVWRCSTATWMSFALFYNPWMNHEYSTQIGDQAVVETVGFFVRIGTEEG